MKKSKVVYLSEILDYSRRIMRLKGSRHRVVKALVGLGFSGNELLEAGVLIGVWYSNGAPYVAGDIDFTKAQAMADKHRDSEARKRRRKVQQQGQQSGFW